MSKSGEVTVDSLYSQLKKNGHFQRVIHLSRSDELPPGDACLFPLTVEKPTVTNSQLNVYPLDV